MLSFEHLLQRPGRLVTAVITLAAPLVALTAIPSAASPAPFPACAPAVVTGTNALVTCVFTGAEQSFTFPPGVTEAIVDAFGAQGGEVAGLGESLDSPGGQGGGSTATFDEPSGTVLDVIVGGQGADRDGAKVIHHGDGFGGGGTGGFHGGQGGGGSFVSIAGTEILVGGGGGGAGAGTMVGVGPTPGGTAGGKFGEAGGAESNEAGQGGSQLAGGLGGLGTGSNSGAAGVGGSVTLVDDSNGNETGGGGGGGGYFGGGSGSNGFNQNGDGGGGGGSGFGPTGTKFNNGIQFGNGAVVISYPLAPTTTTLTPTAATSTAERTSFTATVSPTPNGGTVQFAADATNLGAPVHVNVDGTATSRATRLAAGSPEITATYSGSDAFAASSDAETVSVSQVTNPTITAKVTSAHARTRFGWYRSRIKIRFTCHAGSAALAAPCPAAVALTHNTKSKTVARTITATDDGAATVRLLHLKLDRSRPHVRVTGAKNGARYARKPHLRCKAKDSLSGIASCHLTTHRVGDKIHYKAKAKDRAGNKATTKGHYTLT